MKGIGGAADEFAGLAIVIGNNYAGTDADWSLSNAESDAVSVARNLKGLGYRLYGDDVLLGRTSAELSRDLSGFLDQRQRESPPASLFYFAGHAIESVRHQGVFLLGNEVGADQRGSDAMALDLVRVVNALKNGDGLSVIISDACRHLERDKSMRSSASRRIRQALRESHNTLVYLTTKSENAAFDGKRMGPFALSINELLEKGTKGLSVVEFLTEVRSLARLSPGRWSEAITAAG